MPSQRDELITTLLDLNRFLLEERTLAADLQRVVELAVRAVPAADGSSVTLMVEGRPETPASSDRVTLELDVAQYDADDGPCLAAVRTGQAIRINLVEVDEPFCHVPALLGDPSLTDVLSVPVRPFADDETIAALNLYSRSASGFDDESVRAAEVLAAEVAVAIAKSELLSDGKRTANQLQRVIDDQSEIAVAEGALMLLYDCTVRQAEGLLRSAAEANQETYVDIARRIRRQAVGDA